MRLTGSATRKHFRFSRGLHVSGSLLHACALTVLMGLTMLELRQFDCAGVYTNLTQLAVCQYLQCMDTCSRHNNIIVCV